MKKTQTASLLETNPYLRDPETRRRMLEENAYQSSIFEGAQGLTPPAAPPRVGVRVKKTRASQVKADPNQSRE